MLHMKLAWRNIWRNPKRTAVILAALTTGVWTMIFLGGTAAGMYDSMIKNALSTLTGHIQIHHPDYLDDPVATHSITDPAEVEKTFEGLLPAGSRWTSRIRVPAIAMDARDSAGVTLVGIDPAKEATLSFIGNAVTSGRFLETGTDEHRVIVGKALAKDFKSDTGKKIILMALGTSDENQSRAYRIAGLFQADMESIEKQFVFVTKPSAQAMLNLKDAVSEYEIWLPDIRQVPQTLAALDNALSDEKYEVIGYRDLMPLITAQTEVFEQSMFIWYLVVFVAMGFGIVNTILMAVMERIREFGLLQALGMRPYKIVAVVVWEGIFMLLLGMTAGNLLGIISIRMAACMGIDLTAFAAGTQHFQMPRIIYPAVHLQDIFYANSLVLVLGILVCVYPAIRAARFKPVEALTHL